MQDPIWLYVYSDTENQRLVGQAVKLTVTGCSSSKDRRPCFRNAPFVSSGAPDGRIVPLPRKPSFSQYLRDARVKRRLSVAEVAEQVGVSTVSVYLWETDRVRPRDANLSALCKVLKLPIRATREMAAG
jgi:DNA-binding XRE family transcriptional regulator